MLLDILVQTINSVISDIEPIDVKITTGCLLYSYLNNQNSTLDLRNKALSFKDYYYSQCVDRKITNRTIGFINIERLIQNKNIKTLNGLSIPDYENILKSFNNTVLEEPFDPKRISSRTYGKISFKSNFEKQKYEYLHNEYLNPITAYYKNKYDIPFNNLKIVYVAETVVPAREIIFFIKNYPSDRVVQDLKQELILFKKKPSSIKLTADSFIHIII